MESEADDCHRKGDKKMGSDGKVTHILKSCSGCHTTRTPLWRGGPAGPKSLCNACGIKYNKKRRQLLGLETARSSRRKKRPAVNRSEEVSEILKMRFSAFENDVVLPRYGKLLGKLREEERAALLLMSLSCCRAAVFG